MSENTQVQNNVPAQAQAGLPDKIQPPFQITLPPIPEELKKFAGWIGLGVQKGILMEELTKLELKSQTILKESASIDEREKMQKQYRDVVDEAIELRMKLTRYLDSNLTNQITAPEKRMAYKETKTQPANESYVKYEEKTQSMKLEDHKKSQENNKKLQEAADFKAHVSSDNEKRVFEYKKAIMLSVDNHYKKNLEEKNESPETRPLKELLVKSTLRSPEKFDRKFHTQEEFQEIWKTIPRPNMEELQKWAIDYVDQKYLLYQNDLAQVKSGLVVQDDTEEILADMKKDLDDTVSINTLTSTVDAPVFIPEGKPLKTTKEVVIETSYAFAKHVMMNMLKYPEVEKEIGGSDMSNLSIKRMAKALGDYATKKDISSMAGLTIKEVTK